MNILDKWIFNSINLNNIEVPLDKKEYVLCLFIPRKGEPYKRWLECDKDGYMYYPEHQCYYIATPNHSNVYADHEPIPVAKIIDLE